MEIETVEDLSSRIANLIGCYGACKSTGTEGCEYSENNITCCRVGFMMEMPDRIRQAVKNNEIIKNANKDVKVD